MNTSQTTPTDTLSFLKGGGETGRLIREYNWAATPLGAPQTWPQSLRTSVSICLSSNFPICIYWGPQHVLIYNEAWSSIPGGKHPWALGKTGREVWPEIWQDIEPWFQSTFQGIPTGSNDQLLVMERHGYAEECFFDFTFTPIHGDSGNVEGVFNAVIETTYRVLNERRNNLLQQLAKKIGSTSSLEALYHEAISVFNNNQKDIPLAAIYTIEEGDAILQAAGFVMPPQHTRLLINQNASPSLLEEAIQRMCASEESIRISNVEQYIDDVPPGVWPEPTHEAVLLPLFTLGGATSGFLLIGINPRRELDQAYQTFLENIAASIANEASRILSFAEEKKKTEALAEIDRVKTTFFSNISHEFRTPLTLMLAPIQDVLAHPDTNPENRLRMDIAHRNGLRLQKLVNTLLEFARMEAGRLAGRFVAVDICAFTRDLASTFQSAMEKAGMSYTVRCGAVHDKVYVDRDMWEKIVLNLISNAFKYSRQGSIDVSVVQVDGFVQLAVSDTGVGIPPDQLDKIFDRFHRVEGVSGRSQEGSGIGLAMVKELVKQHGGTISVQSEVDKGSVFTVLIPTGKEHLDSVVDDPLQTHEPSKQSDAYVQEALRWLPADVETDEPNNTKSHAIANRQGRQTVLLADDNRDMREYISRLLEPYFEVVTAGNGNQAFEQALSLQPDLILSDVMMPELDGFGLLQKIRATPAIKNIPFIFLSARAGEEAKLEGLQAGADDYLVKPFSAKELLARVEVQISARQNRDKALKDLYALFDGMPFAVAVLTGPAFRVEFANQYDLNVWQRSKAAVMGKPFFELFPEMKNTLVTVHEQVYKTGQRQVVKEVPLQRADEGVTKTRWFDFIVDPLRQGSGEVAGLIVSTIEITEQVEARQRIEHSENRFRNLVEDATVAIMVVAGPEMKVDIANKAYCELINRTPRQLLGKPLFDAIPEAKHQYQPSLEKVRQTGEPIHLYDSPYKVVTNDDVLEGFLNLVYQPYREAGGEVVGVMAIIQDVTESVVARKALAESEERFRTLATSIPQIVWTINREGKMDYLSNRWEHYTGQTVAEGMLQTSAMVHPDDQRLMAAQWQRSFLNGRGWKHDYRLIHKETGECRWFTAITEPLRNEAGEIVRWIGTATDINDQKRFAQALETLVWDRTKALQQSNEDLQQFAHVASHDLKEPVRKIKTFANRLEEELGNTVSERGRQFLQKINSATDRMFVMIDGVLAYSSINATAQKPELVDLNQILKEIETDLEVPMGQSRALLQFDELPALEGAPVLLYQLFYNLVNNSLKFARAGVPPHMVIRCKSKMYNQQQHVELTFSDNGIGFEQDFAEKIFETFTRLNSKDKYEGTGLGLALCKKIVERHGGMIEAMGVPNEGATFTILLPLKQQNKQSI